MISPMKRNSGGGFGKISPPQNTSSKNLNNHMVSLEKMEDERFDDIFDSASAAILSTKDNSATTLVNTQNQTSRSGKKLGKNKNQNNNKLGKTNLNQGVKSSSLVEHQKKMIRSAPRFLFASYQNDKEDLLFIDRSEEDKLKAAFEVENKGEGHVLPIGEDGKVYCTKEQKAKLDEMNVKTDDLNFELVDKDVFDEGMIYLKSDLFEVDLEVTEDELDTKKVVEDIRASLKFIESRLSEVGKEPSAQEEMEGIDKALLEARKLFMKNIETQERIFDAEERLLEEYNERMEKLGELLSDLKKQLVEADVLSLERINDEVDVKRIVLEKIDKLLKGVEILSQITRNKVQHEIDIKNSSEGKASETFADKENVIVRPIRIIGNKSRKQFDQNLESQEELSDKRLNQTVDVFAKINRVSSKTNYYELSFGVVNVAQDSRELKNSNDRLEQLIRESPLVAPKGEKFKSGARSSSQDQNSVDKVENMLKNQGVLARNKGDKSQEEDRSLPKVNNVEKSYKSPSDLNDSPQKRVREYEKLEDKKIKKKRSPNSNETEGDFFKK